VITLNEPKVTMKVNFILNMRIKIKKETCPIYMNNYLF